MKERPIIFSAPMVRALLAGRKTQTRRILKNQDIALDGGGRPFTQRWDESEGHHWRTDISCPYGQAGDRLWVKETIRRGTDANGGPWEWVSSFFAADGVPTKADSWPWQRHVLSSIHMPYGLRRLNLEVTGVRVERLQDISEADAIAEGVDISRPGNATHTDDIPSARRAYSKLWEAINGAGSWDANPWVWVLEFWRLP